MVLDNLRAEMHARLEALHHQEALLQESAYLSGRFTQRCLASLAEVQSERLELEQLIRDCDEASKLYGK